MYYCKKADRLGSIVSVCLGGFFMRRFVQREYAARWRTGRAASRSERHASARKDL